MARPKKVIDYEVVEKLASIMATQEEIAAFLDMSTKTLQRDETFSLIYKKGLDKGRMSLRRKQFELADKNATMGIWLGKQYLNQKDDNSSENTKSIEKLDDILKGIKENATK